MQKFYDSPGQLRKQCKCGLYLHARTLYCTKCNYEFVIGGREKFLKKNSDTKHVETYDKRGRGKKKCPKCDKFVGCRISECVCSHSFVAESKKEKQSNTDPIVREYAARFGVVNSRVVLTPTGNPPSKPKSTKKEHILQWIEENLFNESGLLYTSALRYRLRQIYGFNTKEFNKTNMILSEWFNKT